jgi:predicted RNase H-like nuclease (RuvC/YqgF family)
MVNHETQPASGFRPLAGCVQPQEETMLKDTLTKIEEKLQTVSSISDNNRTELLQLLGALKEEVQELSKTEQESAESITGFTQMATHEATRQQKNRDLLRLSVEGLTSSVQDFETSHPKLAETVNAFCQVLSNMGI